MAKILLVEDDQSLATLVSNWLKRDHHLVELVADGLSALDHLRVSNYDLLLIDWMLPGLSGLELCRQYRRSGGNAIIFMLTAKDMLDDKQLAFDAGIDDYMSKPFELKELAMRINAQLRRAHLGTSRSVKIRDLEIDIEQHKVLKDGKEVHLLPKEFRLLEFLVRHPNRVLSSEDLLNSVWESDSFAHNDTVRGHINRLRKKLDSGSSPSIIATVHGVGYKLGLEDA